MRRGRAAVAMLVAAIFVAAALAVALVIGAATDQSGSGSLGAGVMGNIFACAFGSTG